MRYRGFESLPLRQWFTKIPQIEIDFMDRREQSSIEKPEALELQALMLQDFIKNYVPATWVKSIKDVIGGTDYTVLADDMAEMEQRYRDGSLASYLENKYRLPAVRSAILDYFRKQ